MKKTFNSRIDNSPPEAEKRKLILANTPAGEEELQALAWGRGAEVRAFLVETGGVAPERVFPKKVDIFKGAEAKEVSGHRVEFGVAAP